MNPDHTDHTDTVHDVIIIGSGPAGYAAAIYTARANLSPLVIASSVESGGELMNTTEVENYPGFPEGIMGPDLMIRMQQQAERFGAQLIHDDATALDLSGDLKTVTLSSGETLSTRTLIYATGSAYRKLGVPGEERLTGAGVSWCATCDGAFFRGRHVIVAGGGDSALEEATFLTRFAEKVTVVHRRDSLRASAAMQDRAFADPKIEFRWNSTITEISGGQRVDSVTLRDTTDGSTSVLPVDGVFIAIGADPRTHLIHDQLEQSPEGTIRVEGRSARTSIPGVFAAGDVIDPIYKQAATAVGSGVAAALDAEHHLARMTATVTA